MDFSGMTSKLCKLCGKKITSHSVADFSTLEERIKGEPYERHFHPECFQHSREVPS